MNAPDGTPYPSSPLAAIDSGGAFEIGGGEYNWGQDYTETTIRKLFQPPIPTPLNALDQLRKQLMKLPHEVLKAFKDLIPDVLEDAWETIEGSVNAIIGALTNGPARLLRGEWVEWLEDTFYKVSTELKQMMDIFAGLIVTPINAAVQAVKDWFNDNVANLSGIEDGYRNLIISIGNVLDDIPMVGPNLEQMLLRLTGVKQKAHKADARSLATVADLQAGWTGGTPSGDPETASVFETTVAIRQAIVNGYTVETYTSNDNWIVPAGLTELWYIVEGGGGKGENGGQNGASGTAPGGKGGDSGGYRAEQIDPSTLTVGQVVPVTVGAAAVKPGDPGGLTSIGPIVSIPNVGSISTPAGYVPSNSMPGRGGDGGSARYNESTGHIAEDGKPGGGSALAEGGEGGRGGTGSGGNGTDGENASIDGPTKAGGGGGGGGGGRRMSGLLQTIHGGNGGNGGYPGAGSGGGGGAAINTNSGGTVQRGLSGTPGHGIAYIMYKKAAAA